MAKQVEGLVGSELDYYAGVANGFSVREIFIEPVVTRLTDSQAVVYCSEMVSRNYHCGWKGSGAQVWAPSTDWFQGGPIIQKEKISLKHCEDGSWYAYQELKGISASSKTPLIAAMQVFVKMRFGESIN